VFSYEWQVKDLQIAESVRVANAGVIVSRFEIGYWREGKWQEGGIHPHCNGKSPELIETKGVAGVH
jgi:hypothetical protein